MSGRIRLLYFSSPEDNALQQTFAHQLVQLAGVLDAWDARQVVAGDDVGAQVDREIHRADIVVLLISADFLAMPGWKELIEKARRRLTPPRIVPLLLRPVFWKNDELAKLQPLPCSGRPVTSWASQDEAWVDIVGGLHQLAMAIRTPVAATGPVQIWNMPMPSAFFTGREEQVDALRQALLTHRRAAVGQVQAISGLGGIGKTQLALEYARRYRGQYRAGFFLRAESSVSLQGGLAEMARALSLEVTEPAVLMSAVHRWLAQYEGWLLVLDNADTLEALVGVQPLCEPSARGHVVITTRLANCSMLGIARSLCLQRLQPEESQRFLVQRTGREDSSTQEMAAAAALAEELDHLPLALEQAGAYIIERKMLFSRYLSAFRMRRMELLKERPVAGDHPDPVATTWAINMQQVREASSIAAAVMELSAFLDPDAIPEELLVRGCAKLGPELAVALSGPAGEQALDHALAPLLTYSLIERQPEQRTYSIHRLVQQVIRDCLGKPAERQWARRMVRALNAVFPGVVFKNWGQCERLVEQAKTAFALIVEWNLAFPEAAKLLNDAAYYLYEQAHYEVAEPLFQRALAIYERALGPGHPSIAASLNNLALLNKAQGKHATAEPLFQRALAIYEKALGLDHPHIATSLNNLAGLNRVQGKYDAAEPLFQRALAIYEKALGPDHPHAANSLNNLANLYSDQGRYDAAEPLHVRALAIYEKVLGPDHPHAANSLNNLANLYSNQGRYDAAESLYQRALAIREKALAPDHPDMTVSLNNLATLYAAQGRHNEAQHLRARIRPRPKNDPSK